MPTLHGISCTLNIAQQIAHEYIPHPDDDDTPLENRLELREGLNPTRTITRYVESTSAAPFAITVSRPSIDGTCLSVSIHIDGVRQFPSFEPIIGGSKTHRLFDAHERINSRRMIVKRAWRFKDIEFTDEPQPHTLQRSAIAKLGEIMVVVRRVQYIGIGPANPPSKKEPTPHALVCEKHLKGRSVSHAVRLGAETVTGPAQRSGKYRDLDEEPVVFVFRYRNRDSLKILGLVARTPDPDTDEEKVRAMSEEEMRTELLRLRKIKSSASIKREREEDTKPMLLSNAGKRKKRITIDLTDD